MGIVALDSYHKTHNLQGSFLSCMPNDLLALASITPGNDLVELIDGEYIGLVCTDHSVKTLQLLADEELRDIAADANMFERCIALSTRLFSPTAAVKQIVAALVL
jgi:hypothetical protein